jgi:hypothetical protein
MIGCGVYFIVVWVLPIIMLPFVKALPYLQERDLLGRLFFSGLGTIVVLGAMYLLGVSGFSKSFAMWTSVRWETIKHLIGVLLGLAVFTFSGAALSANYLGPLVKYLPGSEYQSIAKIENAKFSGTRNQSVSLSLRDRSDGVVRHLVLSKRLFEYPPFKRGDVLALYGKKGLIGVYVTGFKVIDAEAASVEPSAVRRGQ